MTEMNFSWWHWLVFTVIIIACVLLVVIVMVTMERRFIGFFQGRHGPNRTGPFGIFQLIADGIKGMLKEDIIPDRADKLVYWLAPIITFFPTFLLFAVIPFGDRAMLADLNVGILFFLAVGSLSTIGIFMAGWSSNNKYAVISAIRVVASVVSYEIPVILSVVGVILISGSLSLNQIVVGQTVPYILYQPLGFVLFFIGGCAEVSRSPFDLMEADSEIVAGYHTDYSAMKYLAFMIAEYCEALGIAAVIAVFFLSGWKGPGLFPWLWLLIKIFIIFFVMIWIRATIPRVRIDQLMALAWKFLLPLSIINLVVTGIEVLIWPNGFPWMAIPINIVIMAVLILLWSTFFKPGWGKVETGKIRDRYC